MTSHELADPPGTDARERVSVTGGSTLGERISCDSIALAAAVLALASAIILVPFWPGLISYDANSTIYEAEVGPVRDWWSPFLSVLWRGMLLVADTWLLFVVQTLLVVVGVFLCTRLVLRRVPAAIAALLICVYPPLYAQLSGPSRDGYYLGFTLLSLGFLCMAVKDWRRGLSVVLSITFAILSSLCRQNAAATVLLLGSALAVLACRDVTWRPSRWRDSPRRPPAILGVVVCCLAVLALFGGTRAAFSALGVVETRPERQIFIYDLAAMSVELDDDLFPSELDRRPHGVVPLDDSLETLERTFRTQNVLSLYPDGNWNLGDLHDEQLSGSESSVLREAWWDAVRSQPDAYAAIRGRLLLTQLGFGDRPTDGYLGLAEPTNFGRPPVLSRGYLAASDYIDAFVGPSAAVPLDVTWPYLIGGLALLPVLFRSGYRSLRLPAVVMVLVVLFNLATLAVSAMSATWRYTSVSVPIFLVMLVMSIAVVARRRGIAVGLIDTTVLRTVDRTDQVQTSEPGDERVGVA
jgi:hypothetical protein